ncbi:MAG: GNAT family N-acetyltransferase [candidate division Zixibacteria bacterium]|nr:GNAT family N-acetyltransferase [candidate division Zixibacteria bacterium]
MNIHIREEDSSNLTEYAETPMAFTVNSMLTIKETGLGGIILKEHKVDPPYTKDYDACPGEGPLTWADRWDLSNWVFLSAFSSDKRLGGAAVAWNTPGVFMLEGRQDLAVLWDIRIHPEHQGKGVGSHLFKAAEAWSIGKGCQCLKIETQNVNVPACRFYQKQGCVLGAINTFAYPDLRSEICLMWYKDLLTSKSPGRHRRR